MENSQPSLATDSFSYSWLVNPAPTSNDFHQENETDSKLKQNKNFSFDVSISSDDDQSTSLPLVHADNLFSNGLLMPVFAAATPSAHISNNYATTSNPASVSTGKFSRFSRKFLHKYLGFLLPSCWRRRRSKRVDDLDRRKQQVKSLSNTPQSISPRISTASAYSTWSTDYAESSIYEAILYCKKSSEQ